MATYQELRTRSQQVRDEQNIGGNTALRVGQLLMDIVKYFNDNDTAASEYLQQHFAMVNDGTHLLNWQQSPIVLLHTMGVGYDDGDPSALSQGENYYNSHGDYIMEADGQGGGINGEHPKDNVLYVNLANNTLYTWNGASFDAITSGSGGSISGDDIVKNAYYSNGNLVLVIETEGGDTTVNIPVTFDAQNYVPTSRTVNGKALSSNITISQSDIPGLVAALAALVPTSRTINEKPLTGNITIGMADIPGLLQAIANAGSGAVSIQQNADGSFIIRVGNDTYVFNDYPTKQEMSDAIDDALGEAQVTVVPEGSVGVISSLGSDSDEDALSASMGKKLKMAIITILNSLGNYAFPEGKPVIDWGDDTPVTYTVSKTIGTGLSATGGDTDVALGDTLEVTIAITDNLYIVDDDSVVVTMGGQPVAGAWNASTMKVTIAAVTGPVVINVPSMTYVGYGEQNSPLVLMFDGKNQGTTAGQWKNLCNANKPLILNGGYTQDADGVTFNGSTGYGIIDGLNLSLPYLSSTAEGVCKQTNLTPPQAIMVNGYDLNTVLSLVKVSPNFAQMGCCSVKEGTSSPPVNSRSGFIETSSGYLYGTGEVHHFVNYGNAMRLDNMDLSLSNPSTGQGIIIGVAGSTHDSTGDLCVGGYISRLNTFVQPFKGTIYAVRAYSRVLTDAEMTQNHKVDVKRFNIQ